MDHQPNLTNFSTPVSTRSSGVRCWLKRKHRQAVASIAGSELLMMLTVERAWLTQLQASDAYHSGNRDRADDICCSLIADFACPKAVQIQAWQIRAICSDEYYTSIRFLKEVLKICVKAAQESENGAEDETINGFSRHARRMIKGFNVRWKKQWEDQGREPPTEEELEEEEAQREAADAVNNNRILEDLANADAAEQRALDGQMDLEMLLGTAGDEYDAYSGRPATPPPFKYISEDQLSGLRAGGLDLPPHPHAPDAQSMQPDTQHSQEAILMLSGLSLTGLKLQNSQMNQALAAAEQHLDNSRQARSVDYTGAPMDIDAPPSPADSNVNMGFGDDDEIS